MELGLKSKNILIVGGSKGIGEGIVIGFAKENCNIVNIARTEDLLVKVGKKAIAIGAESYNYEVADIMECNTKQFATDLIEKYGMFDVIVHNVGTSLVSRDYLAGYDDWEHALRMNALASIDMNSVLLPPMIERKSGRVIHISSISAQILRGNPLYASSKAFLNAYITTVGRQLAPTGILMCSIMPGAVAFEGSYWDKFIKEGNPRVDDFLRHHQAVNRFGTPEEIANAVIFMASDKSSFMQATNIPVDGANM
ncbi:SDR family NAD(P)-dependent oxidoreductase [Bacteroides stercorirosoris]|uniref:3-oxoacyl-[acyl-carrier protein] reductase n=1 Tax=Bacteroides stercorirosoris TaxID=871324 RepID=A0A1M6IDN3_9BACE|nr:SDR family oxidoreductase [Bacteroides stercorirosoris]SHJ32549.1 3-oxoacyl-[acyl-carrier protein] reductase [Bacteroides stercorirosoris]